MLFSAAWMLPTSNPHLMCTSSRYRHSTYLSPSRCVVIKDSVPGVTADLRAGMKVNGYAAFMSSKSLCEAGTIPFKKYGGTINDFKQYRGNHDFPNRGHQNGLNKFNGKCSNILKINNSFTINIEGSSEKIMG